MKKYLIYIAQGLVCITPGAGYFDITGAFICGILAGPTCYGACQLKKVFQYDDSLDAFGIHGPAGILGGILTGFFAVRYMHIIHVYIYIYTLYTCLHIYTCTFIHVPEGSLGGILTGCVCMYVCICT
jgi:ammonia channel protein AmtB